MNQQPKNTTFLTPYGRAELFFQVSNLDHYLTNYIADLNKPDDKRFHHVNFSDIINWLKGDVLIEQIEGPKDKFYALAFVDGRYYYTIFYLNRRSDSNTLYAVIATCYATNKKDVKDRYDQWLNERRRELGR